MAAALVETGKVIRDSVLSDQPIGLDFPYHATDEDVFDSRGFPVVDPGERMTVDQEQTVQRTLTEVQQSATMVIIGAPNEALKTTVRLIISGKSAFDGESGKMHTLYEIRDIDSSGGVIFNVTKDIESDEYLT